MLYFAEDSDRSLGNFELKKRLLIRAILLRVLNYHHESEYFIRDIYWFLTFNFGNNNEIRK